MAASTDAAVKEALKQESDLIAGRLQELQEDLRGPRPKPAPPPPLVVKVPVTVHWTNAGLVKAGMTLHLKASGEWSGASWGKPVTGRIRAKVGSQTFMVNPEATVTITQSGMLQLGPDDDQVNDNKGEVTVEITPAQKPAQPGPAVQPGEFKSDEAGKAEADFHAAVKEAKTRYGQDLAKAKEAVEARKASATDSLAKDALQKELDVVVEEMVRVHAELTGSAPPGSAFSPVGAWIKTNTGTRLNFLADGRVLAPDAQKPQYAEGTWKAADGKLTVTFKNGEIMVFDIPDPNTLVSGDWQLRRESGGGK